MVSRVFYEAARDLDSPPSPRTDHVEACRPRECCLLSLAATKSPTRPRAAFEDRRGLAPRLDLRVARPHTSRPRSLAARFRAGGKTQLRRVTRARLLKGA